MMPFQNSSECVPVYGQFNFLDSRNNLTYATPNAIKLLLVSRVYCNRKMKYSELKVSPNFDPVAVNLDHSSCCIEQ